MQTTENQTPVIHEINEWLKPLKTGAYTAGPTKLGSCFCTGGCIGPNGERRACNNMQCAPTIT